MNWQALSLEESGGFAGLLRATEIDRATVDRVAAERIGTLVRAIESTHRGRQLKGEAPLPDTQTLKLEVRTGAGTWEATFDTADLPEDVAELKPRVASEAVQVTV